MSDYPISAKDLKKLEDAIRQSFERNNKDFQKQVNDLANYLSKNMTWGQFRVLTNAVQKVVKSYEKVLAPKKK